MSSLRLGVFLVLSLTAVGCSASDPPPSTGCGDGHALFYATAGCGSAAPVPLCLDDNTMSDGCYSEICDCNGKTRVAICDSRVSTAPWSHRGSCEGDGGLDADASDTSDTSDASDASDASGASDASDADALGDGKTSD